MKFARFSTGGAPIIGLVDEKAGTISAISPGFDDMVELVSRFDAVRDTLTTTGPAHRLDEVTLEAPLHAPRRNIFCVGKNYREHAIEFSRSGFEAGAVQGAEIDSYPAVFTKLASGIARPGATIDLQPEVTSAVDYEAELAVVIGKRGKNIKKADAYAHVFGYVALNDVTARDRQKNHKQWFLGKALDGFCPMGPWVATADEVDPENLDVKCWVNGELRQNANTRDLIFDIPTLIESISAGLTLEPGDVIATGTPSGVGIGMKPPKFLKPGDAVAISITGLGRLENRFQ